MVALPGDDEGIVKGFDHGQAALLKQMVGLYLRLFVAGAMQYHFRTQVPNRLHLVCRDARRHADHGLDTKPHGRDMQRPGRDCHWRP